MVKRVGHGTLPEFLCDLHGGSITNDIYHCLRYAFVIFFLLFLIIIACTHLAMVESSFLPAKKKKTEEWMKR